MSAVNGATVLAINVAALAFFQLGAAQIPRPDTVLVPVPFDQLANIRWTSGGDPGRAVSTCGTFRAYSGNVQKVTGRWYTMYMSKIPSTTHHCSQFSNVQKPCGCLGVDFTMAIRETVISFVMFSSNRNQDESAVTYEMMTATTNGRSQLNFYDIIMRGFLVRPGAKITGTGGYIIPNCVVVSSDNFDTYMIVVFCTEGAIKPIVMVLVNALPMDAVTEKAVFEYLSENDLNENLMRVDHVNCNYAQNIVVVR